MTAKKTKMLCIAGAVLASLLAGCGTSDTGITTAVKSKLAADSRTSAMKVEVETNQRVVTLSGNVATAEESAAAEEVARNTKGVTRVVNRLTVAGARSATGGSEVIVGKVVNDLRNSVTVAAAA